MQELVKTSTTTTDRKNIPESRRAGFHENSESSGNFYDEKQSNVKSISLSSFPSDPFPQLNFSFRKFEVSYESEISQGNAPCVTNTIRNAAKPFPGQVKTDSRCEISAFSP
ncbi:MAG: hypothetical protein HQL76_04650 [Magnetococcales bacterium]|nr:hypothetical protein [Magnetococcales bacterium]